MLISVDDSLSYELWYFRVANNGGYYVYFAESEKAIFKAARKVFNDALENNEYEGLEFTGIDYVRHFLKGGGDFAAYMKKRWDHFVNCVEGCIAIVQVNEDGKERALTEDGICESILELFDPANPGMPDDWKWENAEWVDPES